MIAPRKKLWSTPDTVIDKLIESLPITSSDTIADLGCGDGRVILRWAEHVSVTRKNDESELPSFLGIDIDADRIEQAKRALVRLMEDGRICKSVRVSLVCANVIEQKELIAEVTVVFLYLIPRGLRILYPMLCDIVDHRRQQTDRPRESYLRVVTYMSPFALEQYSDVLRVTVPHQPDAHWPLYYYLKFPMDRQREQVENESPV